MSTGEPLEVDTLQGTLDLMVLLILATLGPLHGHALAARGLTSEKVRWDRMVSIIHMLLNEQG